jgi:PAS domain S-box-containing protein
MNPPRGGKRAKRVGGLDGGNLTLFFARRGRPRAPDILGRRLVDIVRAVPMQDLGDIQARIAHFQPLLDGSRHGVLLLRHDGLILAANAVAGTINSCTAKDLIGKPICACPCWSGSPATVESIRLDVSRAAGGEGTRREVMCGGGGRAIKTIELTITPVPGVEPPLLLAEGHDISVHRRLATMLEETVARHEAVLASALDPIITIDAYGSIQSASRTVDRVLGYTPEELIGKNIRTLMPEPHHSAHDGYLSNYRRTGRTHILNRTREFEARRKDGTLVPIELSVSRVDVPGQYQPLFTGIIKDVSARQRADTEIRLLHNLTQAISEASSLSHALESGLRIIGETTGWDYGEVWLTGPDRTQVSSVKSWIRPGAPLEEMVLPEDKVFKTGEGIPGLIYSEGKPTWVTDLDKLEPQRFVRREIALRLGLHTAMGVPVLADGDPIAVILFFLRAAQKEDQRLLELISAAVSPLGNLIGRKQAEDLLERNNQQLEVLVRERTAQLEATHEQLRTADRLASIGTLAAGLGHDMNNVLLPVRCRLDAMDVQRMPDDLREQFNAVRRSVNYLQQLSDGLHLLSLDPEDLEASTEVTDLSVWWEQVGTLLRKALPKHATFETSVPDGLPRIAVPPHRLTQAVLNLIVNAGEAIEERGGKVKLWAEGGEDGLFVRIGVSDNGRGMSEEVKRRAMDPFFTTKKRGLGTGLGLSLVRGVAQGAGGGISIESAPARGTTIVLSFPRPLPTADDESQHLAAVSIRDPRAASFVEAMLRAAGFDVERTSPEVPGSAAIWAVEPSEGSLAAAKQFLKVGRRRVLVFGDAPAAWRRLGAIVINDPGNFESIRRGVGEAVLALDGDRS